MIFATGGFAFGEISIRSKLAVSAAARASDRDKTPKLTPSAPMTLSSLARIALFILILSFKMLKYLCKKRAYALKNTQKMYHITYVSASTIHPRKVLNFL